MSAYISEHSNIENQEHTATQEDSMQITEGDWEGISQLGRDREIRLAAVALRRRQSQAAILDDLINATDTIRTEAHVRGDDDTGACLRRALHEMRMAQATLSRAIREAQ